MCAQCESKRFLNWLRVSAFTTAGGRLFQSLMTLTEKALRRMRVMALGFASFHGCPLVSRATASSKKT